MLLLAPLQGYTEVEFRRAWSTVFTGIDLAVSPFIPLAEGTRFRNTHIRDVIPEENKRMPVIPQVLGNDPDKFVILAKRLQELGYETVNWNLGCPKNSVAKKKRGSGILPYPEMLRENLEKLIPSLPIKLSIKTRLGFASPDEFQHLVKVFNDFPLESLIIHPRIGTQMYEGEMFLDILDVFINQVKHRIVFSGDVKDLKSYNELSARYTQIDDWMIGRGVLSNPFLPEIILRSEALKDLEAMRMKLQYFHEELYCEIKAKLGRPKTILNKMKDYWSYFALWFDDSEGIFKKLARMDDLDEFMKTVKKVLSEQPLAPVEGRSNRQIKIGDNR